MLFVVHIQAELPLVHRGLDSLGWSYRVLCGLAFQYSSRELKNNNKNKLKYKHILICSKNKYFEEPQSIFAKNAF